MDKIIITDLGVLYHVGVPDAERERPQRLLLTLEMETDFSAAVRNDDVRATIDYFEVTQRLATFGNGRSWKLIETLAAEIARMILRDFGALAVTVEVKKFILPETRCISVRTRQTREGS